jgi:hypothetical protein
MIFRLFSDIKNWFLSINECASSSPFLLLLLIQFTPAGAGRAVVPA